MTTIKLPNGSTAIDFTPQDSKEKAIVHLHVIKRLAKLLPKADPVHIIRELIVELSGFKDPRVALNDAVDACDQFSAFHKTVNLIELYKPEDMTVAEKAASIGNDITDGITTANAAIESDTRPIDSL